MSTLGAETSFIGDDWTIVRTETMPDGRILTSYMACKLCGTLIGYDPRFQDAHFRWHERMEAGR